MMANKQMKTLTIGGVTYEIIDAYAREHLTEEFLKSGWTSEQISLLEIILNNIAYIDTTTGQTAAVNLIKSLRNVEITDNITQSGSVLTITALANTPTQSGSVLSIT